MKKKASYFISIIIIALAIPVSNLSSQVIKVLNPTPDQTIRKTIKNYNHKTGSEDLHIVIGSSILGTAEVTKKYNFRGNIFYIPYSGVANGACAMNQFGIDCSGLDDLQFSINDTNVLLVAKGEPWWEPAGSYSIVDHDTIRRFYSNGFLYRYGGMAIDPVNDSVCYAVFSIGYPVTSNFQRSTNRGITWQGINLLSYSFTETPILKVSPFNNSIIIECGYNRINYSTNSGYNFSTLDTNTGNVKEIIFEYENSMIYYVSSNGIYSSDGNCNNFQLVSSKHFNTVRISPTDHNIWFGGDNSGLWRTTNRGITWKLHSNLFESERNVIGVLQNAYMGDTIVTVTAKGVYKVLGDSIATGILPAQNIKINDFFLHQNFPNPFNPATTINYEVNTGAFVRIRIFDITGNEHSSFVNKMQQPGSYHMDFDGNDLASGIYFYSLEADGIIVQTRKMTLLK